MIKCGELSSRHYIKITRLQQVHSISSFKSVISREAIALVGCTGGFEAWWFNSNRGPLRLSEGGSVGCEQEGCSLTPECL